MWSGIFCMLSTIKSASASLIWLSVMQLLRSPLDNVLLFCIRTILEFFHIVWWCNNYLCSESGWTLSNKYVFYERREVRLCNDFHLQYIVETRKNCNTDLYHNQINTTREIIGKKECQSMISRYLKRGRITTTEI
jgi:hypothetical protein